MRCLLGARAAFAYVTSTYVAAIPQLRAASCNERIVDRLYISVMVVALLMLAYRSVESLVTWDTRQIDYAASRCVGALPRLSPSDRRLTDDCCPVCYEDLDVESARLTPCGHTFHGDCLELCLRV